MAYVNQIDLMSAILKHLDCYGVKSACPRQYNAVAAAATRIVKEFGRDPVMATPGMGLRAWMDSDDTGASSMVMASVLRWGDAVSYPYTGEKQHPLDQDDLGRCVRLLEAAPELRPNLHLMAAVSPQWKALVEHWDELESLYRAELPSGKAPLTYKRMRELLGEAES